ncbi:MAG TPA: 3-dehydroquinate synthase [Aquaticitalea sp.]|nr:3-dehydroquinate synthase [Aquaticitalea sp.]
MNSITIDNCHIHFNDNAYSILNSYLDAHDISSLFILADTNTHLHCLPKFIAQIETDIPIEIIEIETGEETKSIETCISVWNVLSELGADRKSLVINLGGGVVTDLGGFVACTYKRGIRYINVPTTLLAMVDASVGGKTGIDLGTLKNQIGIIRSGEMVLVDTSFLGTLPKNQMRSGLAEMLKHGLINDLDHWQQLSSLDQMASEDLDRLIRDSILIKSNIVAQDPFEAKERKYLNFGHTLGHATESFFLGKMDRNTLLHGEAIAIGLVMECFISHKLKCFPKGDCDAVKTTMQNHFGKVEISEEDRATIMELLKYDKKNTHGQVNFVLLESIGKPVVDCVVDNALILEAFAYYES